MASGLGASLVPAGTTPSVISKEHQLSDLRNFYKGPDEHKYGVIALVLK